MPRGPDEGVRDQELVRVPVGVGDVRQEAGLREYRGPALRVCQHEGVGSMCAHLHPQPSQTDVSERVTSASLGPPHRVPSACPAPPWQTSPTRPHTRRRSRVSKRSALASARRGRLRTSWLLTEATQQMVLYERDAGFVCAFPASSLRKRRRRRRIASGRGRVPARAQRALRPAER